MKQSHTGGFGNLDSQAWLHAEIIRMTGPNETMSPVTVECSSLTDKLASAMTDRIV